MTQRPNALYLATGAMALLGIALAAAFLLRTAHPSADVVAAQNVTMRWIDVSDFAPGDAGVVSVGQDLYVIWRRDQADMELAAKQDDPALWPYPETLVSGHQAPQFASDANLTVNGEWLIAWATSANPFGCLPLVQRGDFEGFLDPCHNNHYDLAGRWQKGTHTENMRVISAELGEDGKSLLLDLSWHAPPVRQGRR